MVVAVDIWCSECAAPLHRGRDRRDMAICTYDGCNAWQCAPCRPSHVLRRHRHELLCEKIACRRPVMNVSLRAQWNGGPMDPLAFYCRKHYPRR